MAHPDAEQLNSFALGLLPDDRLRQIAAHLQTCPDCRSQVDCLKDTVWNQAKGSAPPAKPSSSRGGPPPVPGSKGHRSAAESKGTSPAGVPAELKKLTKYRIVAEIGRGAMGVVYKAHHVLMNRPVAIKVINTEQMSNPEVAARFRAEVLAAAQLDHKNIVRALDADHVGALILLVMEYVDGVVLDRVVQRGPLELWQACRCTLLAARGLQHAFEKGVVHRDLKPSNLILSRDGEVKILDFGLARLMESSDGRATQLGQFMGTPAYVSPEQALDARDVDVRSDIYSLGCTLYYLLTGSPPFGGSTLAETLLAHVERPPPPLAQLRPDVPDELAQVVQRMLEKDRARRYQTPSEVVRALQPFSSRRAQEANAWTNIDDQPARIPRNKKSPRVRWLLWPLVAAGAVVLGAVVTWALTVGGQEQANGKARPAKGRPAPAVVQGREEPKPVQPGTVMIAMEPADAELLRDGVPERNDGDPRGEVNLKLAPGTYVFEFRKPGYETDVRTITLAGGDTEKVQVALKRKPAPTPQSAVTWEGGEWAAKNGELAFTTTKEKRAANREWCLFGEKDWGDYNLEMEVLPALEKGYCCYVAVRVQGNNYASFCLLDRTAFFQVADTPNLPPVRGKRSNLALNEWHKVQVQARGDEFEIRIDGELVFAHRQPGLKAGMVGLRVRPNAAKDKGVEVKDKTEVCRVRNLRVTDPEGKVLGEYYTVPRK